MILIDIFQVLFVLLQIRDEVREMYLAPAVPGAAHSVYASVHRRCFRSHSCFKSTTVTR